MMVVPSTPGTGVLIKEGKITAYGLGHHFGGTMIISDGNFLVSIGKYLTAAGRERKYFQNNDTYLTADGQLHIYHWDDTEGWVETINLGTFTLSGDKFNIWSKALGVGEIAVYGEATGSSGAMGVRGKVTAENQTAIFGDSTNASGSGIGVRGQSGGAGGYGLTGYCYAGYGAELDGGSAPVVLVPGDSASAPTHSARLGSLWVTSAGVLYINTSGSTTWQKVGAQ